MYEKKKCAICNAEHRNPKYCSLQCQQDAQYQAYISRWLEGQETGGTANGVSRYVRRYLIEKRGNKCEICNWSEINIATNKVPIEVHHKGSNLDHSEQNLELLCPNHHSLTPTFRALNKGNGRNYRR